jgi:hypothetical protein
MAVPFSNADQGSHEAGEGSVGIVCTMADVRARFEIPEAAPTSSADTDDV